MAQSERVDSRFRVFRAGPADLAAAREAFSELHDRPPTDEALTAFLANPSCYLLLALEDDRVVGSMNGYALRKAHRNEPQFLLYQIDVREGFERRGIGRALIERFQAEARAAAAYEVWVVTERPNEAATGLYRACGMKQETEDSIVWSVALDGREVSS
jgi:ribosomal protein S18 acetylase RimI-like enzyme